MIGNVDMKDVRMEKALEALYDECVVELSPAKRKNCPLLKKLGELLSSNDPSFLYFTFHL